MHNGLDREHKAGIKADEKIKEYAHNNTGMITVATTDAKNIFIVPLLSVMARMRVAAYKPIRRITPQRARSCLIFFMWLPPV